MMRTIIQICGDPTVDWFRMINEDIMVRGGVYYWKKQPGDAKVRLSSKPGGYAMVLQLLRTMIPAGMATVQGTALDEELLNRPKDNRITASWTSWRRFPNPGFPNCAYRLDEWQEFELGYWDYPAGRLKGRADLLIIQDSGLGFRDCADGWPESLDETAAEAARPREIIFRLGQYNENRPNPLLERIAKLGLADKTTMITTLSDLRSCAVKIGVSLSWEQMLEEVVTAVFNANCPFVEGKSGRLKYKRVIVTMGASGIIVVEPEISTIIFDRCGQEGDFASQFPGQMMGYHTCLLGALAAAWVEKSGQMDWIETCGIGIKLARTLHINGYETVNEGGLRYLQFPGQAVADAYLKLKAPAMDSPDSLYTQILDLGTYTADNSALGRISIRGHWTILEENLLCAKTKRGFVPGPQSTVIGCARNVVVKGPLVSLPDVPVETFGAWSSADRKEIEGVRSVNNAMKDYLESKNPTQPLCVAVFGPPGAGKSFVVKEIAKGLGIPEKALLTFNLSQFEVPSELEIAFSVIRDLNLKGIMPLIFWDEFDTPCAGQPLGWLRYFLAPMQDGEFTDHGVIRPLGGGIHVFAGATSHSFAEFQTGDAAMDRAAKKPDFISRLRAYINIRGINGNPNTVADRLYFVRRAFILRQYLDIYAPQMKNNGIFDIEAGVLEALLRVTRYTHGARSLENLVKMSSLANKRKFELSCLPPDHIIEMHANVTEFKALANMEHRETLRIGIAGDDNLAPEQMERLEQTIEDVIHLIEEFYPQHYLTVFSPLAAGADRLAARQLLSREATRLVAVLPFSREEYLDDFGPADSCTLDRPGTELRQELKYWLSQRATEVIEMPPSPTREAAYLKAGHFIADNSDLLIVLWDGDRRNSLAAKIVAWAEQINKKVCHIWVNLKPGDFKESLYRIECGGVEADDFSVNV